MQKTFSYFGKDNWNPRTYFEIITAVVAVIGISFALAGIVVSFFHNVDRYQADLLQIVSTIFLILVPVVYKSLIGDKV